MSGSPKRRERRQRFEQFTGDEQGAMAAIVEFVSSGKGLRAFAEGADLPMATLHDWIRENPDRGIQYDRARKLGATSLVEESLRVIDQVERGADGLPTSATVQHAKLKSDSLKWIAERLSPADWGSSIQVTSTTRVEVDIRQMLDIRERRLMELFDSPLSRLSTDICARETSRETIYQPQEEQHNEHD